MWAKLVILLAKEPNFLLHCICFSYSLTLVDALDTLAVMGNDTEFRRVAQVLIDSLNFSRDINVSVFETNIRGNFFSILITNFVNDPLSLGGHGTEKTRNLVNTFSRQEKQGILF